MQKPIAASLACLLVVGCGPGTMTTDNSHTAEADDSTLVGAAARFAKEPPPPNIDALKVRRQLVDRAGHVHVWLDALRKGHRVLGAERQRHDFRDGRVVPNGDLDTAKLAFDDGAPVITEERSSEIARAYVAAKGARVDATFPDLAYEQRDDVYRLVYRVLVELNPHDTSEHEWRLWIDPKDGRVLDEADVTKHLDGIGHSLYYGAVPLKTAFYEGSGYTLEDFSRPKGGDFIQTLSYYDENETIDADATFFSANNEFGNGSDLDPNGPPWTAAAGPLSATGQTAGVDAHNSSAWAWDLYQNVFFRSGPFGNGAAFTNIVNYPGLTSFNTQLNKTYVGASRPGCGAQSNLDTMAHEIAHGFFASTTITDSTYRGETGGIDEANSDIMGKLTEIYAQNGAPSGSLMTPGQGSLPFHWPDWVFRVCNTPLRYMHHPSLDGYSYDDWQPSIESTNADAHFASGPINRMFYFLAEGVATANGAGEKSQYLPQGLDGITIPLAAQVYYDGVVFYLRRFDPKFADLRTAMETAASTKEIRKAVQDAFAAINVGAPADRTPPTVTNVTTRTAPGYTLGADVADPSGVAHVEYRTNGDIWGRADAYPWSITVPSYVASGSYHVDVCATDGMDNIGCTSAIVVIDATPPTITSFGLSNPYVPLNSRSFQLVASDSLAITSASIAFNPPTGFGTILWSAGYSATTSLNINDTIYIPLGLADGVYDLEATVSDGFNVATAHTPVYWDKTAPNLCKFSGLGPYVPPNGTVNVSVGDATSGLGKVAIYGDNVLLGSYDLDLSGGKSTTVGAPYQSTTTTKTFRVTCIDRAGNGTSTSATVTIDRPPTGNVSMVSQTPGTTYTATYRVYVTDADGIASIGGNMSCTQSGVHAINFPLLGTPTVYDQTLSTGGLIRGETCEIYLTATDKYHVQSAPIRLSFVVQPPTTPCNSMIQSGGNLGSEYYVSVGNTMGYFDFGRNTYTVPDRIDLSCADGGTINGLASVTNGCESTGGWFLTSTLPFNCASSIIKVVVTPNCAGTPDTQWDFELGCAY